MRTLLVSGLVLLELKACRAIEPAHEAQLLHYLRSTTIEVGFVEFWAKASGEADGF